MPQRYAFFLIYANICIILYKKEAPKRFFLVGESAAIYLPRSKRSVRVGWSQTSVGP